MDDERRTPRGVRLASSRPRTRDTSAAAHEAEWTDVPYDHARADGGGGHPQQPHRAAANRPLARGAAPNRSGFSPERPAPRPYGDRRAAHGEGARTRRGPRPRPVSRSERTRTGAQLRGRTGAQPPQGPRARRRPGARPAQRRGLPVSPRLVAVLALVLVAVFGVHAALSSWQKAAADAAQQEQANREAQQQAAERVDVSALGMSALTASTPKSTWQRGTMPHLYQSDPLWAELPYGGGTVRANGCGPTSLAMVYVHLTGKTNLDPGAMAAFADAHNYAPTGATEWAFMTEGAQLIGLQSKAIPVTRSTITQALEAGRPVICSVEPGDFTNIGHYLVLKSIDDRGMVEVFDPNSPTNSARRWGIQRIIDQTANCWAFWV